MGTTLAKRRQIGKERASGVPFGSPGRKLLCHGSDLTDDLSELLHLVRAVSDQTLSLLEVKASAGERTEPAEFDSGRVCS